MSGGSHPAACEGMNRCMKLIALLATALQTHLQADSLVCSNLIERQMCHEIPITGLNILTYSLNILCTDIQYHCMLANSTLKQRITVPALTAL
jgi:hypothetical protein